MNWQQFQSLLWLRWRLTRNQWSRGGAFNVIIMVIATSGAIVLGMAGGIAGLVCGALPLSKAPPEILLLVWDGVVGVFLFVWVIGVLTELQRSENIDLARLLHLPVSVRQVFLLNYVASHLTVSLILFVPGMLGLSVGLMVGRAWQMVVMIPVVLSFLFLITAWTYCLRGWLITLMVNQRRRRTVIMVLTMSMILVSQLPNLYFNVWRGGFSARTRNSGHHRSAVPELKSIPSSILTAHYFVPPLWVANGAMTAASGAIWPSLCATLGGALIGALGLARAYRSTVRFYRGEANAFSPSRSASLRQEGVSAKSPGGESLLEMRLPFAPEQVGALSLALLRSLLRAPEVKMALGSNLFGLIILGFMFFSRGIGTMGTTSQLFVVTGIVAFPFLGLLQLMFNVFGLDRDGFRALVLLPVPREHVLLAKNLAFLPMAIVIGVVLILLSIGLAKLSIPLIAAACFQFLALFLLLSVAGNLVSILAPYRVAPGSLKPTKAPGRKMFLIVLWQFLFPLAMAPVAIPAGLGLLSEHLGWLPAAWIDLASSILLAAAAAAAYSLLLPPLGRFLQKREKMILETVTQEVE